MPITLRNLGLILIHGRAPLAARAWSLALFMAAAGMGASASLAGCGDELERPADESVSLDAQRSALALAPKGATAVAASSVGVPPGSTVTLPGPAPAAYTATALTALLPAGINNAGIIGGEANGNIVTRDPNNCPDPAQFCLNLSYPSDAPSAMHGGALNDPGSIVGFTSHFIEGISGRGFVWIRPLPAGCADSDRSCHLPIEIVPPNQGYESADLVPRAINNGNVVVGTYNVAVPVQGSKPVISIPRSHAFRWSPASGFEDITPQFWTEAAALDINDAGEVVGWGDSLGNGARVGLRWSSVAGRPPLVAFAGSGAVDAIENNGVSAGESAAQNVFGPAALFMWSAPTTSTPSTTSTLAAPSPSHLDDVSNRARVVGDATLGSSIPGGAWTLFRGALTTLPFPAPSGSASAAFSNLHVNDCGSIVGTELVTSTFQGSTVIEFNGFLWTKPGCDAPLFPSVPIGPITSINVSLE